MKKTEWLGKRTFWLFLGCVFVIGLFLVPQYGISGDEVTQWHYGELVWRYLSTFGKDKTVLTSAYVDDKLLQYYGGFVDGFVAMLIDVFHPKDPFLLRHYWNFLLGFGGIVGVGLLAQRIKGWRAAIFAVLFLILTPRYWGPLFNNPKDIPFATGYIWSLLMIIEWLKRVKNPSWKTTILLGLAFGFTLSIRVGGILVIAYLGLFYLVEIIRNQLYHHTQFAKSLFHATVAVVLGWLLACLWWPYAWEDLIAHPLEALIIMSDYPIDLKTLYGGQILRSFEVPRTYLFVWMGISLPIALLVGFIAGLPNVFKEIKKGKLARLILLFAFVFPLGYIVVKHSIVYDGLRHILFLLPIMAILAGLFVDDFLDYYKDKKQIRIGFAVLFGILWLLPLRFMIMNHPNEYVYFNEFEGGLKGAYGDYETDYYSNSLKQGLDWLKKNKLTKTGLKPNGDSIIIGCNMPELMEAYQEFSEVPFKFQYVRFYERNTSDWDYGLFTSRFLDHDELVNQFYPGPNPLHLINADGVPLCSVLENDPERNGLKGDKALRGKENSVAVSLFEKALKKDPQNLELWRKLALAKLLLEDKAGAQEAVRRAYAVSSLDLKTIDIAGKIFMNAENYQAGFQVFQKMTEDYPDISNGWFSLGLSQMGLEQYRSAISSLEHYIKMAPRLDEKAVRALAYCYDQVGNKAHATQLLKGLDEINREYNED